MMASLLIVERLKSWALTAFAVLLVLVGAYAMGGRASKKAAEKKRDYDEALRAAAGAKGKYDAELDTRRLPPGGAFDELGREWMRRSTDNDTSAESGRRDGT